MIRRVLTSLAVVAFTAAAELPAAHDTVLFSIGLTDDTTSLFGLHMSGEVRRSLSGPVLMEEGRLLFYSCNGYVLYDRGGVLVDSHSVFKVNGKLAADAPGRLRVAYPLDPAVMLYYRETPGMERAVQVYRKRLMKKRLRPIKDEEYSLFSNIVGTQLFNLTHNSVTDEMAPRSYLMPQLVGFTHPTEGRRWWSLDKFYSISSPVIGVDGASSGGILFPGIKDERSEVRNQLIEPVQCYVADGRRFYLGVRADVGATDDVYHQTLYFIDHAGNVMYEDSILKQVNKDAVLGEDEATFYTTKRTARFVFQPMVDPNGDVYYGVLDLGSKKIDVHYRSYAHHRPRRHEPDLAHLIDVERTFSWKPLSLRCGPQQASAKSIPDVTITELDGTRRLARARDLSRDEHLVRIYRKVYRDIDRKLSRRRGSLPEAVEAVRKSLADESTSGCPYGVSLSGPRGMLVDFSYAPGEQIVCARVIAVREGGDVVVRVDLADYAEILLFSIDGQFLDRFVFNRQSHDRRKDIVAASPAGPIIEADYEGGQERFYRWEPEVVSVR